MRIDNNQTNFDPTANAERTSAAQQSSSAQGSAASAKPAADQVRLSPDAQLASSAIAAAAAQPDVRPDVVARAKALLADGQVGNDPERLADKLIDSALKGND